MSTPAPPALAVKTAPPSAAEHAALVSHLQGKYGVSPALIATLLPATGTRQAREQHLTAWARTLPKAS